MRATGSADRATGTGRGMYPPFAFFRLSSHSLRGLKTPPPQCHNDHSHHRDRDHFDHDLDHYLNLNHDLPPPPGHHQHRDHDHDRDHHTLTTTTTPQPRPRRTQTWQLEHQPHNPCMVVDRAHREEPLPSHKDNEAQPLPQVQSVQMWMMHTYV